MEEAASKGGKVVEKDVENLTELLMMRLIKLDGIVAEGDLKLQRRVLVLCFSLFNVYVLSSLDIIVTHHILIFD